jgi:thiamine-phosphate pyrophosphorylase
MRAPPTGERAVTRSGLDAAARRSDRRFGSRRAALPRLFLFSDPVRLPDPSDIARRLPRGAAVVARGLAPEPLAALAEVARRRRLALLVAGDGRAALRFRAGLHAPDRRPTTGLLPFLLARRRRRFGRRRPLLTAAAHGWRGIARARRLRADAVVLSPVFPTASHPGAAALGPLRWAVLARRAGRPAVALGGVRGGNARRLPTAWTAGFAAVGGF